MIVLTFKCEVTKFLCCHSITISELAIFVCINLCFKFKVKTSWALTTLKSQNFNWSVFCGYSKVIEGRNATAMACRDPQNYASWDGVHLTEAVNKMVAYAILSGSYFDPTFSF